MTAKKPHPSLLKAVLVAIAVIPGSIPAILLLLSAASKHKASPGLPPAPGNDRGQYR
jgi:hypothetical protein